MLILVAWVYSEKAYNILETCVIQRALQTCEWLANISNFYRKCQQKQQLPSIYTSDVEINKVQLRITAMWYGAKISIMAVANITS